MTSVFTVDEVSNNVRDFDSQYGAMKAYKIHLMPTDATTPILNVEWRRKATSPAPVKGQQLEGNIEDGQFGKVFKQQQQQQMPIGSSGPRKSYEADPKKQAAIAMEACHKVAVDLLRLHYSSPANELPETAKDLVAQAKQVAAALFGQIEEVSK